MKGIRMYRLSIETEISAAHQLRDYDGPCARVHGHNWKIKVEVTADRLNEVGIAIDFSDLKNITWSVIGRFDHNNFNDLEPFDKLNPTAENIAKYFYDEISTQLPQGIVLTLIEIWETEKYRVAYGG
jgi:6-pyruvoyltetrahydropterin/6-carboxytetrahydropterin synthase